MAVKTVVVILRAFPGTYSPVAPPPSVAGIAFDGAFDASGLQRAHSIEPEVVLLDLRGLAEPIGLLIGAARIACPRARIIAIGMPYDEHMAEQAIVAGAAGFMSRDLSENALRAAVANTAQGALHLTSTGIRAIGRLVEAHHKKSKT